jgi:hypothetical protein
MEYTIKTRETFQQVVEALISALEDRGFAVQRSFDLHSALDRQAGSAASRQVDQGANYCILAVEPASTRHPSQGNRILVIYQHKEQPILSLLRAVVPLPRRPAAETISPPLESALVDLLLDKGWWSMEDIQTAL